MFSAAMRRLVFIACLLGACNSYTQTPFTTAYILYTLTPGAHFVRNLKGDESHLYPVQLTAGDFFELRAHERGVDVNVSIETSTGAVLAKINYPGGDRSLQLLRYVATDTAQYTIRVQGETSDQPAGKYEVEQVTIRPHVALDEKKMQGQELLSKGLQAFFIRTPDGLRAALPSLQEARIIWQQTGDRDLEAATDSVLGISYQQLSNRVEARKWLELALPLLRETNNPDEEATDVNYLGGIYDYVGDLEAALVQYSRALELFRQLNHPLGQAAALNNVGLALQRLGEPERARECMEQALMLVHPLHIPRAEIFVLSNLADLLRHADDFTTAEQRYRQALTLREKGDMRGQALTLSGLGFVVAKLGRHDEGVKLLLEARDLFRKAEDTRLLGTTLASLGVVNADAGKWDEAESFYQQALVLHRQVEDKHGELSTLERMAALKSASGHLPEARAWADSAIQVAESQRARVASPDLRSVFLGVLQQSYAQYVDASMRINDQNPDPALVSSALEASERARARTLVETLPEVQSELRKTVDPSLAVRQADLNRRITQLADAKAKIKDPASSAFQTAKRQLDDAFDQAAVIEAEIRKKSPAYARFVQAKILNATEMQAQLAEDTVALEYFLGEERSWAWLISPQHIWCAQLPGRKAVEQLATTVYESMRKPGEPDNVANRRLSEALLGPFQKQITGKRLLIVPSGALHYIPFSALLNSDPTKTEYLITTNEVVTIPSLSVLAMLRHLHENRTTPPKTLAVVADSVYSSVDERLKRLQSAALSKGKPPDAVTRSVSRAAVDAGLSDFHNLPPLAFAGQEIRAVSSRVPAGQRVIARDFMASKAFIMGPEPHKYRNLHLIAHGFIDSSHPALSGLVLSMVDQQGRPVDGFLRVPDVFRLDLPADLVVLSACQTALGRKIDGEGIVGLTQGFMHAGATRVVASLWNVQDLSTSHLMGTFYKSMFGPKPRAPSAALRAAQLRLLADPSTSPPYYWAPFVLQGEWR